MKVISFQNIPTKEFEELENVGFEICIYFGFL